MANELPFSSVLSKFSLPEKSDWIDKAAKETGLSDPMAALTWQATKELSFLPIYDHADTASISYEEAFSLRASNAANNHARFWLNIPPVAAADAGDANEKALDHLLKGADGVFFFNTDAIEKRLDAIDLAACSVSFAVGNEKDIEALNRFVSTRPAPQNLNLLWKGTPLHSNELLNGAAQTRGVRALGLIVRPGDPIAEIVTALLDGVTLADRLTDEGFSARDVLPHIHFSMATSSDFFLTMAKLRVVRLLWYQVLHAYGLDTAGYDDIFIHARCEPLVDERFQPHGALISNTTASIAAVCGGCDALTVVPEENQAAFTERIARNVSTILADEAHLNKVADPFAGSYFVETIIRDMAAAAWNAFKKRLLVR